MNSKTASGYDGRNYHSSAKFGVHNSTAGAAVEHMNSGSLEFAFQMERQSGGFGEQYSRLTSFD